MTDFNLQYHLDTQGRKWLVAVMGTGSALEIPSDVYGIAGGAFMMTGGLKEIYIPKNVQEIMGDVFGGFGPQLTIRCGAKEKPEGWADSETVLNSDETGMERIHNYWLGSAKFTFDANGILSYLPLTYRDGRPKVLWNCPK
ncbi:MAG: hypothetical protein J6K80_02765 [Oscillospiraceae bacterium]|nr:hypothetical protein [Oscillospiraceae bacterium]